MDQIMKEVYDKVTMNKLTKEAVRNQLASKKVLPMWIKSIACVYICMIALFVIPSTRTMIVNAASNIIGVFRTVDGDEVEIRENGDITEVSFSAMYGENQYFEVAENRIYITMNHKRTDITDRGGVLAYTSGYREKYCTAWFLETVAYCSVDCYALISGYVNKEHDFKISRFIIRWIEVFFCLLSPW